MVNQFRTLLCNLAYDPNTPQDHLCRGFNSLVLPKELELFRRLFFPDGMSRADVLFATHNLVNSVYSTTLRNHITSLDKRVTYDPDASGTYFSATRVGTPQVSNPMFPLFVSGDYVVKDNKYEESIRISQIDDTLAVRIYSGVNGQVFAPSVTLSFDGEHLSQVITLTELGLSVQLGGDNISFVASGGKTWQVIVAAPRSFDLLGVYATLKANPHIVDTMLRQPSAVDTTDVAAEWRNNSNVVYKMAAILVCYVSRVSTLIT